MVAGVVCASAIVVGSGLRASADADPSPSPEPVWLVGDLHVHVTPADSPQHATLTVESALEASRRGGLDFVVFTPHDAHKDLPTAVGEKGEKAESGQAFVQRRISELGRLPSEKPDADAENAPTKSPPRPLIAVSGWEFTRSRPGHLGVSFTSVNKLREVPEAERARAAVDAGGFVVVNHPFLRPVASDQPIMKMLKAVRSWEPFRHPERMQTDRDWNAIEVWHDRSAWVQALHHASATKFPDTQMTRLALQAWDRATLVQRRRITAVGGSDAHGRFPYTLTPLPLTSVLVEERTEAALGKALLAARVTFGKSGGVTARTFAATSDVKGETAIIGGTLKAQESVTLTWTGPAQLFENGKDVGNFDGGTTRKLPSKAAFAFWRIECPNDAYSNMIYSNLGASR